MAFTAKPRNPYRMITAIALPALLGQNGRIALKQTGLDQARVACALERFRLAKKAYPEVLTELTPTYLRQLPPDVVAGEAPRYHRTRQGYQLYSVGLNGQDDGGQIAMSDGPGPRQNPDRGDWVWNLGTE